METDVVSFANKWKTRERCANGDLETAIRAAHPCDANVQYKRLAANYCGNVTGKLFAACHGRVDPAPYYEDCLYDVCSCSAGQLSRCYCQILASYALECAHQDAIVDWRKDVRECGTYVPTRLSLPGRNKCSVVPTKNGRLNAHARPYHFEFYEIPILIRRSVE